MNFDPQEYLNFDREHIWHPYASATNADPCYLVESAKGVRLQLAGGHTVIDGMSSWWAVIHGYNNEYINKSIENQLSQMAHVMFGGLTHRPAITLAEKLLNIVPHGLNHIFYCDSGSVSVEVSMKIALQYWFAKSKPERCKFATIRSGYHGDTWHAMSVCDPVNGMHSIYKNRLSCQLFCKAPLSRFGEKWNSEDEDNLKQLFENHGHEMAAFILEPIVQGAGGMHFYHPLFLNIVRSLCYKYDVLLIIDEIATGFGRTGKLFASEWAKITPDIMCIGKALTGGYLSFAATLTTTEVAKTLSDRSPGILMHGPTFMGNPLACAAANASLDLLEKTNILENVTKIETILKQELPKAFELPQVADVRILGSIGVIETFQPISISKLQALLIKNGCWLRPFGKLVYMMPPLIISDRDLKLLIAGVLRALKEYCNE